MSDTVEAAPAKRQLRQKPTVEAAPAPSEAAAAIEAAASPEPQQAPAVPETLPAGFVKARIMRKGHRKIFTGETSLIRRPCLDDPNSDDKHWQPTYAKGDIAVLQYAAADKYEADGWVEILE